MVWTAQTSTLGPPLVVEHGDICLGLYGEDSWWPLRVQTDGRAARLGPTVEVVFFGNTQTNRWARNKLRPFSDLHSIPSHSMPKRCAAPGCRVGCARVRDASRPPDGYHPRIISSYACLSHAARRSKRPSRRRASGSQPPRRLPLPHLPSRLARASFPRVPCGRGRCGWRRTPHPLCGALDTSVWGRCWLRWGLSMRVCVWLWTCCRLVGLLRVRGVVAVYCWLELR